MKRGKRSKRRRREEREEGGDKRKDKVRYRRRWRERVVLLTLIQEGNGFALV